MGVKGLYSYLKHYRNDIDPLLEAPQRIGVDAMSLLYRFRGATGELLNAMRALRGAGHTLFFVFDGKPPAEKEPEVAARKEAKADAASQAVAIQTFLESEAAGALDARSRELLEFSVQRCQNQSWHMTRELRRAFQGELWKEGIPYVKSLSEADDVLLDLATARKLDVILTTDMDYLLGGVKRLWVPTRKGALAFEDVSLADILSGEELTWEAFRDAGLLCGTAERAGARGLPCSTAFSWMRHYGSLEALHQSNVRDMTFRAMFPTVAAIERARTFHAPPAGDHVPYARMRPDHFERVRAFLEAL